MKKYINWAELKDDFVIIDILSDKSYEKEHIKWAKNFSIYETAFPDKIQKALPDKETNICVYGLSDETLESERAYNVLHSLGYKNVSILENGLKKCKSSNIPIVEWKENKELNWRYEILSEKSRIEWTWRNIWNKHTWDIKVKKWYLLLEKWKVKTGNLEIDMTSIDNFDLKDSMLKNMLIWHLKSADFFDVEKFPTSTLSITKVEHIKDVASKPNFNIVAELMLKWITKSITFDAYIREKEWELVINAHLDIDRSRWNIMYWSAKFFARLGNHIVDDMISLDLILFAEKKN